VITTGDLEAVAAPLDQGSFADIDHVASSPQRRTRAQHSISRPRIYTNGTVRYATFLATGEPESLQEALSDKN
jgi:hypothetical protein